MFGIKLAKIVSKNVKLIEDTYLLNSKKNNLVKVNQFSHFDLHPHNIWVKKEKVICGNGSEELIKLRILKCLLI